MLPFLHLPYLILRPNSTVKYNILISGLKLISCLNVAKTEFMIITSRHKLQSLNDYTANILGLTVMKTSRGSPIYIFFLHTHTYIHEISKKVSSSIGALKRVRPFVSIHTAIQVYKDLFEPHFDHCSAV